MPRFKLTLEYDGTPYAGWQRQDHAPTVQGAIEKAIFALAQEEVTLHTAGRTDSGVHARVQVAHFDLTKPRSAKEVMKGLNFHLLQESISVLAAEEVGEEFHARFSATRRAYEYIILNRPAPPKLELNRVWHVRWDLDAHAMHTAAQHLVGAHDFSSFRDSKCQSKSAHKTLDALDVTREGERIFIRTHARSFLHHMVRNIVGTLELVGSGKWSADDVLKALEARDRTAAGPTAPPEGLYLVDVRY